MSEPSYSDNEDAYDPQPSYLKRRRSSLPTDPANKKRKGSTSIELLYTYTKVLITLDDSTEFEIMQQDLKKRCAFFQWYRSGPFPDHFQLEGNGDSCCLFPGPTSYLDDPHISTEAEPRGTLRAFQVFFKIVCQETVDIRFEIKDFLGAAKLAVAFKANDATREVIMSTMTQFLKHYASNFGESLCMALEAAYHLKDLNSFNALAPEVVIRKLELQAWILSLPVKLQYSINTEHGFLLVDLRFQASKILQLLYNDAFIKASVYDLPHAWMYRQIQDFKDDDTRIIEFKRSLRALKQATEAGMFRCIDDGTSEEAKKVLKELRVCLDKCFHYEDSYCFMGLIPWDTRH